MNSRFETYSFLPPPSKEMIDAHIDRMLSDGLVPLIEYNEDADYQHGFWHQWHLSKNTKPTRSLIHQLLRQCVHAHPEKLVRLSGYNTEKRVADICFIVRTPEED